MAEAKAEKCEKSFFRGHKTFWDIMSECWRYVDTGDRAGFDGTVRPCSKCGECFQGSNVGEADPCLGELPGVDNACCGHGVKEEAYIRFTNGVVVTGFDVAEGASPEAQKRIGVGDE